MEKRLELFRRFFVVNLSAFEYGLDSTVFLPTVLSYATVLKKDATRYVSYIQLFPSIVQFFISLLIGPTVAYFGFSPKWCIIAFLLCSAAGNFLYASAGPHAIGNVWAMVGGRMLSGAASGAASLSISYLVLVSTTEERLPAMSMYRAFVGISLVLGPLLSIPFVPLDAHIGQFRVNKDNAPAYTMSGIALIIALMTVAGLQNRHTTKRNLFQLMLSPTSSSFSKHKNKWLGPGVVLLLMLHSSFLLANVFFLMSTLLKAPEHWNTSNTSSCWLQAVVFASALAASTLVEQVRSGVVERTSRGPNASFNHRNSEIDLCLFSYVGSILGALLIVVSLANTSQSEAHSGSLVCFLIGCATLVSSYNVQAASLPSLFSKCLPLPLRSGLTPWYAATVAAGKVLAPPIIHSLGASPGNRGWIGSQALCMGLSLLCTFSIIIMRNIWIDMVEYYNERAD